MLLTYTYTLHFSLSLSVSGGLWQACQSLEQEWIYYIHWQSPISVCPFLFCDKLCFSHFLLKVCHRSIDQSIPGQTFVFGHIISLDRPALKWITPNSSQRTNRWRSGTVIIRFGCGWFVVVLVLLCWGRDKQPLLGGNTLSLEMWTPAEPPRSQRRQWFG